MKTTLLIMAAGIGTRFGTGQAVLACKEVLHEPFAVINADDYYGKEAFVKLHNFLVGYTPEKANQFCMAGFILKNGVYQKELFEDLK